MKLEQHNKANQPYMIFFNEWKKQRLANYLILGHLCFSFYFIVFYIHLFLNIRVRFLLKYTQPHHSKLFLST